MKLITSPNSWSCAAASLAMVLGIDFNDVIKSVGHDGSEIINPDLRKPGCYKGFHMQELIEIALAHHYAVTPIELQPVQTATGNDEYDVKIEMYKSPDRRLLHHMNRNTGILMGKLNTYWHAVAWDGAMVYDPRGLIYPYGDIKINLAVFHRFDFFV